MKSLNIIILSTFSVATFSTATEYEYSKTFKEDVAVYGKRVKRYEEDEDLNRAELVRNTALGVTGASVATLTKAKKTRYVVPALFGTAGGALLGLRGGLEHWERDKERHVTNFANVGLNYDSTQEISKSFKQMFETTLDVTSGADHLDDKSEDAVAAYLLSLAMADVNPKEAFTKVCKKINGELKDQIKTNKKFAQPLSAVERAFEKQFMNDSNSNEVLQERKAFVAACTKSLLASLAVKAGEENFVDESKLQQSGEKINEQKRERIYDVHGNGGRNAPPQGIR